MIHELASEVDYLQKAKRAKKLHLELNDLDAFIHPDISADMISQVVAIESDGWCGFRSIAHAVYGDQNNYMLVKRRMQERLLTMESIYRQHFGKLMDKEHIDMLVSICQYGLDDSAAASTNCPLQYWFIAPGCVQLVADTYGRPVALYPSSAERSPVDPNNYVTPPLLFLPFDSPSAASKRPLPPIILQHNNGNHWITMDLKQSRLMKWPIIERGIQLAYESSGRNPRSLRKHIWRHLDIKKNNDD
ncbi:hypothetical protein BCR43DRAFT_517272 [Syncephalastrum racemosum]|uniref:OTU domain-containing protein n=1 Tax=Syncephalastrum racemosum TaxID=13706 RepID=A0A1X2H705_SYNRA|nr:hypothetical protein BCR43DRAFT_517272 [Syncephalastrum racemosum]